MGKDLVAEEFKVGRLPVGGPSDDGVLVLSVAVAPLSGGFVPVGRVGSLFSKLAECVEMLFVELGEAVLLVAVVAWVAAFSARFDGCTAFEAVVVWGRQGGSLLGWLFSALVIAAPAAVGLGERGWDTVQFLAMGFAEGANHTFDHGSDHLRPGCGGGCEDVVEWRADPADTAVCFGEVYGPEGVGLEQVE